MKAAIGEAAKHRSKQARQAKGNNHSSLRSRNTIQGDLSPISSNSNSHRSCSTACGKRCIEGNTVKEWLKLPLRLRSSCSREFRLLYFPDIGRWPFLISFLSLSSLSIKIGALPLSPRMARVADVVASRTVSPPSVDWIMLERQPVISEFA